MRGGCAAMDQLDCLVEVDDGEALLQVADLPVELGCSAGEGAGVVRGLLGVADTVISEDEQGWRGGQGLDQASGSGEFADSR